MSLLLYSRSQLAPLVVRFRSQLVRDINCSGIRQLHRTLRKECLPQVRAQTLLCIRKFSTKEEPQAQNTPSRFAATSNKLKELWRNYGYVAVGTYLGIYGATLTSIFFLFDFNIIPSSAFGYSPQDALEKLTHVMEAMHVPDEMLEPLRNNPWVATFALAWLTTKFTEPLRLVGAIALTPKIARYLKPQQISNSACKAPPTQPPQP